ncbi:CvpA family protein [Desulfofundulus thermosubterraneus]|uniref:Membrane protein required for colicin V production n=1 Tax=Desulfofundulus thermosubterraneus DSM 16057 TaxID=1121432 RepID=A0A1M6D3K0_9FIRM|nr:CvpA family protein [Desulfofundulus thermosubterraneus]SHI67654.1 membrane protein required for colicin V production [Desulfofundulus thermosubterraneus DSM 16057]
MNWLDLVLLWIIAWSTWRGMQTGLVAGLARLCGLLVGLVLAREFQAPLAAYISRQWPLEQWLNSWIASPAIGLAPGSLTGWNRYLAQGLLEVLSFVVILLVAARLIGWLGQILAGAARFSLLGPVDRAGGLVLGIVRGVLAAGVLLAVILALKNAAGTWLPGEPIPWLARAVEGSRLIQWLDPIVEELQQLVPLLVSRYTKNGT